MDRRRGRAIAAAAALGLLAAWLLLRDRGLPSPAIEAAPPPAAPRPVDEARPASPPAIPPAEPVAQSPEDAPASPPAVLPEHPGLPLRIVVRDGTTCSAIEGAALVLLGRERGGKRHPLRTVGTDHFLDPSPLRPGEVVGYAIEAVLPEGYVQEPPRHLWMGGTSVGRTTERVEATLLVWPEARVRVRVVEEDGRPVADATIQRVRSGNVDRPIVPPVPTDGHGESRLEGIPAIPGELVRATASAGVRGRESGPEPILSPHWEVLLRVVLPPRIPPDPDSGPPVEFVGTAPGEEAGGGVSIRPIGEIRPPPGTGSLRVRVLHPDGTPAAGAALYCGGVREKADTEGVVRFPALRAGEQWVMSADTGSYLAMAKVAIGEGSEAVLEMREAARAEAAVLVLDAEGAPVPGADLDLRFGGGGGSAPVCVMEGGVQRIGIHTGPDGRRLLSDLPIPTWITARIGTRSAWVLVEGAGPLQIRLPPAK